MPDPSPTPPLPPRPLDVKAAFLSYLLPGLGQIVQGRIGKGLLFFFGVSGLFYYGWWMGQRKNVWLPPTTTTEKSLPDVKLSIFGREITFAGPFKSLAYRPQFLGQFWVGVAAWPAILQNIGGEPLPVVPPDKTIAEADQRQGAFGLGRTMLTPTEAELNALQRDGDKRWDLAWVYTLIAGVLNLLVIYDAFAGPAINEAFEKKEAKPEEKKS